MRREQMISIFALSLMSLRTVVASPIPALNLRDLVRDADLIAVGQISRVQESGQTSVDEAGRPIPARAMTAILQVSRVVKGPSGETLIPMAFAIPEKPLGYAGIAVAQFGMFFLRVKSGLGYVVANPYYPFIVASTSAPVARGSDFDRVIGEVAQVLVVPGASPDERRRAIDVLGRVKTQSAIAALRITAKEPDSAVGLRAVAALLRQDDVSVLTSVENVLVSPPGDIDPGLLRDLAFAIQDGIKNQEAIPVLTRLLGARDVQTRRAAASALRHTEVESAVGPLLMALEDDDREVRYQAVLGLATITGQSQWGPALDQFEREEERYLAYWRKWAKTR